MPDSRTKNASRNIMFGVVLRCYQIVVPFVIRTAMMYYMGLNYLGLNSLFTSVLFALSIAELGVGSAMVYSMYLPIIEKDTKTICALLKMYRTYYRIIGAIIGAVGLALTPAIPMLVKKDVPADINLYVVYWLNLLSTVMTYWLYAYKNSLLVAHQRRDIISKITLFTNTLMYVSHFVVIIFFRDYYLYLIVQIITQVLTNIITSICADKKYPDYKPEGDLPKAQVDVINGKIKDLFTMKIGMVIITSADSIVISAFLGLHVLGVYQNYFMIITALLNVLLVIYDSVMSGIGDSIITETPEKNYNDLKRMTFLVLWLVGFCSAELVTMFQPFMSIWSKGEILPFGIVIAFAIFFYVDQANQILVTFKDAAGIWHEDRFRPLATAGVNLLLNVILVQFIGLYGIIFSTVFSIVVVGMPWILKNLFTTLFKRSMRSYVGKLAYYTLVTAVVTALTYLVTNLIPTIWYSPDHSTPLTAYLYMGAKLVVCAVVSNLLFYFFFRKTKEYGAAKELALRMIHRG